MQIQSFHPTSFTIIFHAVLPLSQHNFLSISRSPTGSSAVAADVVAGHPLDLTQDGLGELLHDVVLANVLVALKSVVERLLFAVLQH